MGFRAYSDVLSDAGTSLKPEAHSGLTLEGFAINGATPSSFTNLSIVWFVKIYTYCIG